MSYLNELVLLSLKVGLHGTTFDILSYIKHILVWLMHPKCSGVTVYNPQLPYAQQIFLKEIITM